MKHLTENNRPTETLAQVEKDEIAYTEAVAYAGKLATQDVEKSEDNYGGALLSSVIPFGD